MIGGVAEGRIPSFTIFGSVIEPVKKVISCCQTGFVYITKSVAELINNNEYNMILKEHVIKSKVVEKIITYIISQDNREHVTT